MLTREDGSECHASHPYSDIPTTAQSAPGRCPYNFHTRDDNGRSQIKVYIFYYYVMIEKTNYHCMQVTYYKLQIGTGQIKRERIYL